MPSSLMPDFAAEDYKAATRRLYEERESGDLVLVCGGKDLRIHSSVLTLRSKFFATAANGCFKEALTKRIELPDDDPHMVDRLISHCYMRNYTTSPLLNEIHTSRIHTNVHMYALAEKYDISGLKKEAIWKFTYYMKIKTDLYDKITALVEVIPAIYTTTPDSDRTLRDYAVAFGLEHWDHFLALADLGDRMPGRFLVEISEKLYHKPAKIVEKIPYEEECVRCGSTGKWKVHEVKCSCGRWEGV